MGSISLANLREDNVSKSHYDQDQVAKSRGAITDLSQLDPSISVYKSGGDTTGSIAEGYTSGEITISAKRDKPKKDKTEPKSDNNSLLGMNKYVLFGGLALLIIAGVTAVYLTNNNKKP